MARSSKVPFSSYGHVPARPAGGDDARPVLVVGLGRFGSSVAESLVQLGHEVLAIDSRPDVVQRYAASFTHVIEANTTQVEALRQVGAQDFELAVVGIGSHIESSILTVSNLSELGVAHIWAKAITREHGRILERVGATEVVYPEHAMGARVAHLVTGRMMDFIEFEDDFAIVKTRPPAETLNRTLDESAVRTKYRVTVIGTKRPGKDFVYATPETVVHPDDVLIVCGPTKACERFAAKS